MKGDMVAGGYAREAAGSSDEIRLYFPTWLVKYAEFSEDYRGIRTLHALLPLCVLSTETYTFDLHFSFCCLFFGASTSSYAAISAGDGEAEEPEKCGYIYSKAFSAFTYSELGVRFESVCAPTFYMWALVSLPAYFSPRGIKFGVIQAKGERNAEGGFNVPFYWSRIESAFSFSVF